MSDPRTPEGPGGVSLAPQLEEPLQEPLQDASSNSEDASSNPETQELQPHELHPQQQEICRFIAMGYTNKEISELTGYTRQWIGSVRNNPLAQPLIRDLMKQRNSARMAQVGRSERLDHLRDSAYGVIDEIMADPAASKSVRLRAAGEAVRAHKEHVETSNPEDRPVFDTDRIKQLLAERKTLYVEAEAGAQDAEGVDQETHALPPAAEDSEGREDE